MQDDAPGMVVVVLAVVVLEVPGDGVGSGVEAFAGQFGAQRHDEIDGGLG